MSVLGALGFIFLALFAGAIGQGQEDATKDGNTLTTLPYVYIDTFEYVQQDSLRYPTCVLSSDFGDSPLTTMADHAFLAGLAYRPPGNETQFALDQWFSEGAVEQVETVEQYREEFNTSSAVSFKLVTFPSFGDFAYVVIRGTQNTWDMLTDAQLWSAAALLQVHRALLPFGQVRVPWR